jgi:hypothetical protein
MTRSLFSPAHRLLMPILAAAGVARAESGTEPRLVDSSGHWIFGTVTAPDRNYQSEWATITFRLR